MHYGEKQLHLPMMVRRLGRSTCNSPILLCFHEKTGACVQEAIAPTMRSKIFENLLQRVPCAKISSEFKKTLVRQSDGLTGAWMREVVQSALIEAAMDNREVVRESDLKSSISDVLDRRGLAYKSTPNLGYRRGLRDAEASYLG